MLKVVQDAAVSNENAAESSGSLLDEIVRDGARQMLAAALRAEVAAYVEAHDEGGRRLVVHNGHHAEREVTTAAGALPVGAPWVNDKRIDEATGERRRFSSAILPAWSRKSPRVAEVLPLLYLHGLSFSDFALGGVPAVQFGGGARGGAESPGAARGRGSERAKRRCSLPWHGWVDYRREERQRDGRPGHRQSCA